MAKNSKKTGSSWERDVCKKLSKWINNTEKPYVFWRSGGSGSVYTISEGEAGKEFSGDIYCIREEGKFLTDIFSIECKSGYDNASFNKHLKYNKSDTIYCFWEQCVNDAHSCEKWPMLIFKKKGYSTPWVGISYALYEERLKHFLRKIRHVHLSWEEDVDLPDVHFFELYEFLHTITPSIMIEEINK